MVTVGSSNFESFSQQHFGWSPGGGTDTMLSQAVRGGGRKKKKTTTPTILTPPKPTTPEGMTRTSQAGQEVYRGGRWVVTKTYAAPTTTPTQSKDIFKMWGSRIKETGKGIGRGVTETIRAGGYINIPTGLDYFNIKRIGYGTSFSTLKEREAREQDIMDYNVETDLFSQKQGKFLGTGGVFKLPYTKTPTTSTSDIYSTAVSDYGKMISSGLSQGWITEEGGTYQVSDPSWYGQLVKQREKVDIAKAGITYDISSTPSYVTLGIGKQFEFAALEKERGAISSRGEMLEKQYGLALEKEKVEKAKTFESKWETRLQGPIAREITMKVFKRENLFSEGFKKEYLKGMPLAGEVDLGIAQGAYSMIREKPVEVAGLFAVGFAAGPLFGAGAKAATWFGKKIPISVGFGSKAVTSAQVAAFGIKVTPYVLGGAYAAGKTYELFSAETQFEKGQVFGKGLVEVGALGLGAGLYKGIKTSQARKAFLLEAERSPLKIKPVKSYVMGKDVVTLQRGTQKIFGRDYGVVVKQYGIIQKGGYQTIKGSKLVTYGYQGKTAKLVRADLFSQGYNVGTGQFKKTGSFFNTFFGKKGIKASTSYTKIKPTSTEIYDPKGNEIWNMFGQKLKPSYSRSLTAVKKTGKTTYDFFSVKLDKLKLWKTGQLQLMGDKFPAYGSVKVIKVKGAAPPVDTGVDAFSFVYSKKAGTWFNPKEWVSAIKTTKITPKPTKAIFVVTPKPTGPATGKMFGVTQQLQQLTLAETAPTYVGGQGKSTSIFWGQGAYESGIGSFIGKTYAPTVSGLNFGGMGKGAGLITGFDFIEKWKQPSSSREMTISPQSFNLRTSFISIQPVIQAQPQKTITKTGQGLKQVQITETIPIFQPIIPIPITPTPITPQTGFFKVPPIFGMPSISAGIGKSFNLWGRTKKRPYKYQPSMTAILFGIKGKQPKTSVTGFTLRPIPITKPKRRKKK